MRTLLALLLLPCLAFAQPERYELGKRLKAFELAWEKQTDKEVRKKAMKLIEKVTPQFFGLQFGEAGRTLDEAKWVLEKKEPSESERWLASLYIVPEKFAYKAGKKDAVLKVKSFYKSKTDAFPTTLSIGFAGQLREVVELGKLPMDVKVPLNFTYHFLNKNYGDHWLDITLIADGRATSHRSVLISILPEEDTAAIREIYKKHSKSDNKYKSILAATGINYFDLHDELLEGAVLETEVPIRRYSSGMSNIAGFFDVPTDLSADDRRILNNTLFALRSTYLSIPIAKSNAAVLRVMVPEAARKAPSPVVIALHGAGGSENLFFEGYGAGHIVKQCEARGWVLIAPRSPLFNTKGPPIKEILDGIAEFYPIDRENVFLVGHSMGAAQAVALAQEHPEWYRAVAALGGGGRISKPEAFDKLPLFIGIGDKDFALGGAKKLAKDLAGKSVTYKEYPDLEHMVIVREALPDVFKEWDKHVKPSAPRKLN